MLEKIEGAVPAIGPYSAGLRSGSLLFVSGQLPAAPDGRFPKGIRAQTEQCLLNLQSVLEAGGSDLQHVLKTTVFLRSIDDFAVVNDVYARFFTGEALPARSCVQVAALPKNAPIEIEAIALVKE